MISKQARKIFFRNIPIIVLLSVFSVALIALTAKTFIDNLPYLESFDLLSRVWVFFKTQGFSEYVFIFFLIVSYEYFGVTEKASIKEALSSTPTGVNRIKRKQFLVMASISGAFFVFFVICNVIAAGLFGCLTAKFLIHIIISTFLNFFLIGILAVLAGAYIASLRKKVTQYIALLAIVFLTSSIFTDMFPTALVMTEVADIFPVTNLFDIFPPNLKSTFIFPFGTSVLPYRFEIILFWCLLTVLLMSLSEHKSIKNKRNIALLVATCLCFTSYCIPESMVKRNTDPAGAEYHDYNYYVMRSFAGENLYDMECNSFDEESTEPFSVKSYKLDFFVANYLYGKAEIEIDDTKLLSSYIFTLYHGYKVTRIEDESGNKVTFNRRGDFIQILNGLGKTHFTVYYCGSCPKFYSNFQGIALPGDLAYYPVAGLQRQYDKGSQNMLAVHPETVDFEVKVHGYAQRVFCNLPETGRNSFKGTSNGVTLLSGFYEEYKVDNCSFVCSYLDGEAKEENFRRILSDFETSGQLQKLDGKKIMVMPSLNQGSYGTSLDDHIVSQGSLSNFIRSVKGADKNA